MRRHSSRRRRSRRHQESFFSRRQPQSLGRALHVEMLEDRRMLSAVSVTEMDADEAMQLFSTSTALFVENQGQWADEEVRYEFNGDGVNIAFTDDFNSDGTVDGEDLDIWEGGFGTTTDANLDDGDSDEDGDVDGNDFLNWQRNYSPSPALGAAAGSTGGSEATDAGGSAFYSTTDATADALNNATSDPLGPVLTRGGIQDTPAPPTDRHSFSFESVDYAGWSSPQPMPTTNGNISAWLDLPQFQSRGADRPLHRVLAVDTVMSQLAVQNPRVELNRLHEVANEIAFVTTEYDDIARPVVRGVAKVRYYDDALDDRADLEAALEELWDAPWQESKGVPAF